MLQAFAHQAFGADDPIGRRVRLGRADSSWLTVVGVSPDIMQNDPNRVEKDLVVYLPNRQDPMRGAAIIARTRVAPTSAIAAFRKTLELNPGFAAAREMLACSYAAAGRKAEALAELEQVKASAVEHVAMRAWILGVAGDTAGSRRLIQELQQRSDPPYGNHPAAVAALHGMLGDSDRAFALLDQAYAERDWMLRDVKVSPLWDSLRKDPRFPKLLQQMHLD